MSKKQDNLKIIEDCGIVAVIRTDKADLAVRIAEAVASGGILPIEITMTVPDAFSVIAEVRRKMGGRILLGAGTVLSRKQAEKAIRSGAEFIVSPGLNLDVIKECRRLGMIVVPGAFTPTEIVAAWQGGADIVKLFPASLGGPGLIKDLRGPFPEIKFMPTGGVTLENAADFIRAGATAIAVGGNIVDREAIARGDFSVVTGNARRFLDAVKSAR